ncbi:ATP synthase F1 subunit delta [Kamptonema cortianum]|nr:ATP synthase F1 subunit delta [Kamptonema cortianum]
MSERRVAYRYARALFNAALSQDIVQSVDSDLVSITNAISSNDGFRSFLKKPQTSEQDKIGMLEKVFSDKVTALTMSFMRLLVEKRRDDEIFGIRMAFQELRRNHENLTKAIVASAEELDKKQRDEVVSTIAKKTGRNLEPEFIVDPALIGGVKVTYGDYVLDGSVRGQLDRLKEKTTLRFA